MDSVFSWLILLAISATAGIWFLCKVIDEAEAKKNESERMWNYDSK